MRASAVVTIALVTLLTANRRQRWSASNSKALLVFPDAASDILTDGLKHSSKV